MPRWSAAERGSRTQLDAADTAVQTSVASSSGDRGQEGAETPLKPRGRRWGSSAGYDTHSENPGAPPVAAVGDNAQHDGGSSQSAEDAGSAGQQPNQLFVSKALVEKNSAEAAAVTAAVAVARKNAKTAARFAGELFQPQALRLSHQAKGDISSLGQTIQSRLTPKLWRDLERVGEGNVVYWPGCVCRTEDHSLFRAMYEELSPWEASPYKRSRHPACVEESKLLTSPTYRHVVAVLRELIGLEVGYSIVNLYADGSDWTEYHRDNYKGGGNRVAGSNEEMPHNVTVGASFGDQRELRFRHLDTEVEFSFPQLNGDVFAFTEPVNSAFQHCIPRLASAASAGPRISVILWGRTEKTGILGKVAMAER
eukprot:TRINITY_DN65946_c0_g1_i1.p1 TRINITY_DN65946_c0_g1~~TRINITY_DN65946_c0_g1_i1.p1  ORF type:complete len:367 (+),score=63.07 TRINITY_DN65946_c0_g1_i1:78-1178(+)